MNLKNETPTRHQCLVLLIPLMRQKQGQNALYGHARQEKEGTHPPGYKLSVLKDSTSRFSEPIIGHWEECNPQCKERGGGHGSVRVRAALPYFLDVQLHGPLQDRIEKLWN